MKSKRWFFLGSILFRRAAGVDTIISGSFTGHPCSQGSYLWQPDFINIKKNNTKYIHARPKCKSSLPSSNNIGNHECYQWQRAICACSQKYLSTTDRCNSEKWFTIITRKTICHPNHLFTKQYIWAKNNRNAMRRSRCLLRIVIRNMLSTTELINQGN